jgi:dTDP-4-amino-4,6-dideoxygalactose transaminase
MFTAYKNLGFDIKDYPNAYNQYSNEVTLPLHTLLSEDDVYYICDKVNKYIKELNENDYV